MNSIWSWGTKRGGSTVLWDAGVWVLLSGVQVSFCSYVVIYGGGRDMVDRGVLVAMDLCLLSKNAYCQFLR